MCSSDMNCAAKMMGSPGSQCYGPSMLPTFNARGDVLLSEFYSVYTDGLQIGEPTGPASLGKDQFSADITEFLCAGDVVMARSPQNPKDMICKRVLGLGGDDVVVVPAYGTSPKTTVRVPRGHVWLQGDNTINSTDSRTYGPVPYALLRGRAFLKVPHYTLSL